MSSPDAGPGAYLAMAPELFWTAQPQLAVTGKAQWVVVMPDFLVALQRGLQTIACSQADETAFLAQLAALHQQALEMMDAQDVLPKPVEPVVSEDVAVSGPSAPQGAAPATLSVGVDEEFVIGAWLELITHRKIVRTQLTWASPQKTLFSFTVADGNTQFITRRMRDKLAADGSLRVVPAQPVALPPLDKPLHSR